MNNIDNKQESTAYIEGKKAFKNNVASYHNPYSFLTKEFDDWAAGWDYELTLEELKPFKEGLHSYYISTNSSYQEHIENPYQSDPHDYKYRYWQAGYQYGKEMDTVKK